MNLFGEDSFRYGVKVKEPKRPMQPFTSTLPRLSREVRSEPFKRQTVGVDFAYRQLTYLPVDRASLRSP